ncbi:MAG: DUF4330 domain-containing protein [Alkaliphilus sp.]
MKVIDSEGKLFGIINWIDFVVLIVILAIGLFAFKQGLFFTNLQDEIGEENELTVKVLLLELTDFQVEALLIESGRLQKTGRNANVNVVSIEINPAKKAVETSEGKIVNATVPNQFEALVVVRGAGSIRENKVLIGTIEIKVGTELRLLTKHFEGVGVVFGIQN